MDYKSAFPSFDDELPVLEGFYDDSWHNDACPSLCKDLGNDRYLKIYIDYKDKALSDFYNLEDEFYFRFGVYLDKPEEDCNQELLFQSNKWEEVKQFIKGVKL